MSVRRSRVVGIVALVAVVVTPFISSAADASASIGQHGHGARTHHDPPVEPGFSAISCGSSTTCVASTNGGTDYFYKNGVWTKPASDGSFDESTISLSCPSATFCETAVGDLDGNDIPFTSSGGTTWKQWARVPGGIAAISCVSSTFCLGTTATDNEYFGFDGHTWSDPEPVTIRLGGVECASATLCLTTHLGKVFTYNGTSWSHATALDTGHTLFGASCVSNTFCLVLDDAGRFSRFNGTSWSTPAATGDTTALQWETCGATTFCIAWDRSGRTMIYNGTKWSAPAVVDAKVTDISCTGAGACVLVDSAGNVLRMTNYVWGKPVHVYR